MSKKKSEFIAIDSVPDDYSFNVFGNGADREITKPDLFTQIKDESFSPFIYPTVELLQNADLEADDTNPTYVRCEETEYRLYKITNLAAGVDDIVLDNGNTATYQVEYRDIGFVVGPVTSVAGSLAIFTDTGGAQLDDLLVPTTAGKAFMQVADGASITFPRKNADNTVSMLGASAHFNATKQVSAVGYAGVIKTADNTATLAQSATDMAITPANLAALKASSAEVIAGANTVKYVTPETLQDKLEEDAALVVETFADLATTPATTAGMIVYVKAYASGGKGGGTFQDTAGTITNDNVTIINNSVTAGRHWKRINYDALTPYMAGATGDGATNDSPAFQRIANFFSSRGYGKIDLTSGKFILNTLVTFTNCDLIIVGDGMESCSIGVNNATGGILINQTSLKVASPNSTEYHVSCSGFSMYPMVARVSGFGGSGYGLKVARTTRKLEHTIYVQIFRDLSFRTKTDVQWTDPTSPQFNQGLYLTNASQTLIDSVHVDHPGAHATSGIRIENGTAIVSGTNDGYYQVHIDNVIVAGCKYSIHQTGWLEGLRITNCELTSSTDGAVYINAEGTTINGTPLCYCGDFVIADCHINGQTRCVDMRNIKNITIHDNNMYYAFGAASGGATHSLAHIKIDCGANGGGETYKIHDNYFNNSVFVSQAAISAATSIDISSSRIADYINIHDNTFKMQWIGSGAASSINRAINILGQHDFVDVSANDFESVDAPASVTAVFYQSSGGFSQNFEAHGNKFRNYNYDYLLVDISDAKIVGGRAYSVSGGGQPILWQGSNRGRVRSIWFTPISGRTTISGATPSTKDNPDCRFFVSNGSATSVTNFTDAANGDIIDLSFTNGNTTIVHGATIFLQGSANHTFASGTSLYLKLDGTLWIEQSRRT